jgi:uncharacterized protein YkwD
MRKITTILFLFISLVTFSQTNEELSMMYEINKIRKDPKSYIPIVEDYVKKLEEQKTFIERMVKNGNGSIKTTTSTIELDNKNNNHKITSTKTTVNKTNSFDWRINAAKELIKELNNTEPMDTLVFDTIIYPITVDQANYLKEIGKLGHGGRNGKTLLDRTKPYVCSENAAHTNSGYEPLLALMVDYSAPNRGHRKNILNRDATSVSISINDYCLVQNFVHPHKVIYDY